MSKPIFDKKKQLKYIKSKLHLISFMIDQLELKDDELDISDFKALEKELMEITKKTKIFNHRNDYINIR